jgi:hypothetical protein
MVNTLAVTGIQRALASANAITLASANAITAASINAFFFTVATLALVFPFFYFFIYSFFFGLFFL